MELLLYLAEFHNGDGASDDPLEVDRMMQSQSESADTDQDAEPNTHPTPPIDRTQNENRNVPESKPAPENHRR